MKRVRKVATDAEVFRAIANYTYDWESWIDVRGRTAWVNPAVERLTGYTVGECLRMRGYPLPIVHPDDRTRMRDALRGARAGTSVNDLEFRARHKNGSLRWLAISWQPIAAADGAPLGYRSSVRDIDERKAAEVVLHEAKKRAEDADRAKSEFLAVMSHEIRSPMQSIAGYAELLGATALDGRQRGYVDVILRENAALLVIVDDILQFSSLGSGGMRFDAVSFDYRDVLGSVIASAMPRAEAQGIRLRARVDDAVPAALVGDPTRVRQVLLNLVANALKFTARGKVDVRVRKVGRESAPVTIETTVSDTGTGIRARDLPRLFEMFEQVDSGAARRHGGSGLGLAISKRMCERMGGTIGVESTFGKGSRFRFVLPHARAAEQAPKRERRGSGRPSRSLDVLVVDDSQTALHLAREFLLALGHRPVCVGSGRAAIAEVRRADFDVVLVDMQMPDMDGATTARKIHDVVASRMKRPTVLALTANVFAREWTAETSSALDGVLTKPIDLATLRAALERHAPSPNEPRFDAVIVRELAHERGRDGRPLLVSVVDNVIKESKTVFADLSRALRARDGATVSAAAHRLKGLALAVGAREAAEIAEAIEERGAAPRTDRLAAELRRAFASVLRELRERPLG